MTGLDKNPRLQKSVGNRTASRNPYAIRWSKFTDGERMPFLVRVATGLPLQAPTYWITSFRRPPGRQPNTLRNDLRGLMYLHLWADARGVDLQDRLESGALLTLTEVNDLDTFCGKYLRDALAEISNCPTVIKKIGNKSKRKQQTAQLLEKRNRLYAIYCYIEYTSADYLSRHHLHPEKWKHYNSVREQCLGWINARFKAIKRPKGNDLGDREGLEEEDAIRLRNVIEPDHPENPFEPKVRFRNFVMVKLMLDLGIRRGELMGIRVDDCKLGSRGTITIHRRPDDPVDPRTIQPSSKTNARVLPLGGRLTELLYEWIVHHRPKIRGARRHPFLIVASTDGKPLSLSSVNKMMTQLRKKVPGLPMELCPHVLRHTWNDGFSDQMDKKGVPGDQEAKWRTRLMGWRREASAQTYLRRTTRRRADKALLDMQESLDIQHSGAGGAE